MIVTSPKDWVDILAALSTPTLAVFGIYIAWRQWRTAELKRQHEFFDRRFEVYKNLLDVFDSIGGQGAVSLESIQRLHIAHRKARFLFNKDIGKYIKEVINRANNLYTLYNHVLTSSNVLENQRKNAGEKVIEDLDFFNQQTSEIENKFSPYLKIEQNFFQGICMNWRRGLFRVWIVAGFFWIVGAGWYQYDVSPKISEWTVINFTPSSSLGSKIDKPQTPKIDFTKLQLAIGDREVNISEFISNVLLLPFCVWLLFPIIPWIRRGFRMGDSKKGNP